jgi:putative acetyltransferase
MTEFQPDRLIRRAHADESDAIARLYRRTAEQEWPFLFPHTPEEDRAFFRKAFDGGVVWAAIEGGVIVGFCALRRGWIDHLFVAHERHGRGVGQALLARALADRRRVKLWTFQRNLRSRAFYRMQGFEEVLFTDGAANEEKEPDVLLEWIRGRQKRE